MQCTLNMCVVIDAPCSIACIRYGLNHVRVMYRKMFHGFVLHYQNLSTPRSQGGSPYERRGGVTERDSPRCFLLGAVFLGGVTYEACNTANASYTSSIYNSTTNSIPAPNRNTTTNYNTVKIPSTSLTPIPTPPLTQVRNQHQLRHLHRSQLQHQHQAQQHQMRQIR